jgi:hypothetical protein
MLEDHYERLYLSLQIVLCYVRAFILNKYSGSIIMTYCNIAYSSVGIATGNELDSQGIIDLS